MKLVSLIKRSAPTSWQAVTPQLMGRAVRPPAAEHNSGGDTLKRDLDLARSILRQIEAAPTVRDWIDVAVEGRTDEEVSYHVMLLAKEGLVEATDLSSSDGFVWKPIRLTWAGHEFLDAARDESRWTKAKEIVLKRGGGLTFEVLKAVLIDLMRKAVL